MNQLNQLKKLPVERQLIKVDKCPCCSSKFLENVAEIIFDGNEIACKIGLLKSGDILNYTLCKSCSFLFFNPRYAPETLKVYYQEVCNANNSFWLPSDLNIEKYEQRKYLRYKRSYNLVKSILNKTNKVVDIGGQDGASLAPFIRDGAEGFVIDPGCNRQQLISPNLYSFSSIDEFVAQNKKVDCILSFQTLEHIYDPYLFLSTALSILDEQGIILFEVPYELIDLNFITKNYRANPSNIHAEHINFFSIQSLKKLAIKLSLQPIKITPTITIYPTGGLITSLTMIARKVNDKSCVNIEPNIQLADLRREMNNQLLFIKLKRKLLHNFLKLKKL